MSDYVQFTTDQAKRIGQSTAYVEKLSRGSEKRNGLVDPTEDNQVWFAQLTEDLKAKNKAKATLYIIDADDADNDQPLKLATDTDYYSLEVFAPPTWATGASISKKTDIVITSCYGRWWYSSPSSGSAYFVLQEALNYQKTAKAYMLGKQASDTNDTKQLAVVDTTNYTIWAPQFWTSQDSTLSNGKTIEATLICGRWYATGAACDG
jgi:hypothetical protein